MEPSHLEPLGFEHYYVNHSITFVDPIQKFIHTNGIERIWRSLRASISHVRRSVPQNRIRSFLDCFQFEIMFKKEELYDVLIQIFVILYQMNNLSSFHFILKKTKKT